MKHLYRFSFKNEQSCFCFMFDSPVGESPQCEGRASLFSEPEDRSSCPPPTEETHAESAPVKARHTFRRPRVARPGLTHPVTSCPPAKESPRASLAPPALCRASSLLKDNFTLQEDEDRIAAPFWRTPYAINLFLDSDVRTASVILRRVEISAKWDDNLIIPPPLIL